MRGEVAMGQVTIYIDEQTELNLISILQNTKKSKSKWISDLINEKIRNEFPNSVKELAGSWKNFPNAEELRKSLSKDIEREQL